uniref:Uncharacterized protein n=1 Tax=viral metagenome TaxID=1070528 RepID=A0A6M3L7B4_9ZZZZ
MEYVLSGASMWAVTVHIVRYVAGHLSFPNLAAAMFMLSLALYAHHTATPCCDGTEYRARHAWQRIYIE